jgi:misacylated tRNA(Ala) deacylase
MEQPVINEHNKAEFPPMHTAEHILNGTMVKTFGCKRACGAHVERTKSKLDYVFPRSLTDDEVQAVEDKVNQVIAADLPVTMEYVKQNDVADRFDLDRLPDDATQTVRIVHVGDYDECLCAGSHVEHTAQIGHFRISSTRYQDGKLRIVFRLDD